MSRSFITVIASFCVVALASARSVNNEVRTAAVLLFCHRRTTIVLGCSKWPLSSSKLEQHSARHTSVADARALVS